MGDYERKSYSLNVKNIRAIASISANKGKPESHIADKYISEGITKDITTTEIERYNARMNCIDLDLSDIMKCQNQAFMGERSDKIVASCMYELSFLGRSALSKRQKIALFSLSCLLSKLKEVDEDVYAEIEKQLKFHRKLCKFLLPSDLPNRCSEDTHIDSINHSDKDEQLTDEEYLKNGKLRK